MQTRVDIPPPLLDRDDLQQGLRHVRTYLESLPVQHSLFGPDEEIGAELRAYVNSRGVPVLVVELFDGSRQVVRGFTPEQLLEPSIVHLRLADLRRELLRNRSHEALRRVRAAVSQMPEDD